MNSTQITPTILALTLELAAPGAIAEFTVNRNDARQVRIDRVRVRLVVAPGYDRPVVHEAGRRWASTDKGLIPIDRILAARVGGEDFTVAA